MGDRPVWRLGVRLTTRHRKINLLRYVTQGLELGRMLRLNGYEIWYVEHKESLKSARMGCYGLDRVQWWAPVNTVLNLRVP
jgi:hypothetical protein